MVEVLKDNQVSMSFLKDVISEQQNMRTAIKSSVKSLSDS